MNKIQMTLTVVMFLVFSIVLNLETFSPKWWLFNITFNLWASFQTASKK